MENNNYADINNNQNIMNDGLDPHKKQVKHDEHNEHNEHDEHKKDNKDDKNEKKEVEEFGNLPCNGYCTPLYVYVGLTICCILFVVLKKSLSVAQKVKSVGVQLLLGLVMGYIIYLLCSNCNTTLAWVLLLVPACLVSGTILLIVLTVFTTLLNARNKLKGMILPSGKSMKKRRKKRRKK